MPDISIIMPVYNADKTVGRMIESIIAQTFTNWELIAVNDGSKDGSGRILDEYAKKDSRIRVIHKENGGVAAARQDGIDASSGVYTIHADSDDWVEPDLLGDMYAMAVSENADIVIADFYVDRGGQKSEISIQKPDSFKPDDVLYALYSKRLFGGLWHKLIRKDMYNDIRFTKGINYCEDLLILTKMLSKWNPTVSYLPKAYYHYVLNQSSLTQSVSVKGFESLKKFHKEALRYFPDERRFADMSEVFRVDEFIILFLSRLYKSSRDLINEYAKIKPLLKERYGMRWRLGFWCIGHGFTNLAHHLIKY